MHGMKTEDTGGNNKQWTWDRNGVGMEQRGKGTYRYADIEEGRNSINSTAAVGRPSKISLVKGGGES